ncbi:MAG: hypothetical protein K8T10_00405 [Candidatus Eremiobacteraeota bacterium]|nr:hypothetical protein [Candidatus Eremiobacteraeota bacterium]
MSLKNRGSHVKISGCYIVLMVFAAILIVSFTVFYILIWRVPDNSEKIRPILERQDKYLSMGLAIPPDQNGWTYYEKALKSIDNKPLAKITPKPPWYEANKVLMIIERGVTGKEKEMVEKFVRKNAKILKVVDKGYEKNDFFILPYIPGKTPRYRGSWQIDYLGYFLILMGDRAVQKGEPKTAARYYLEAIHIEYASQSSVVNSNKISFSSTWMARRKLMTLMNKKEIPAKLLEYITDQLKRMNRNQIKYSDIVEYDLYSEVETMNMARNQSPPGAFKYLPVGILIDREKRIMENCYLELLEAIAEPYPSALKKIDKIEIPKTSFWRYGRQWIENQKRKYSLFLSRRVELKGTLILAALHWYRAKNGKYPDKLSQLVPNYLKEIPRDPFSTDGKFRYKKEKDGTILLYSVGVDMIDDGGTNPQSRFSMMGDIIFIEKKSGTGGSSAGGLRTQEIPVYGQ